MKRLLSAISVLCILFLIVQTSREYQENSVYTYEYSRMPLLTGKSEAEGLECIRSLYRMRAEREENAVVGTEFTPDADLLERMANAKDCRENDYELLTAYVYYSEKLVSMGLVNTTENFSTFIVGKEGIVIEITGEKYLYADIEYASFSLVSPKWKEADFDRDGVNELAMITCIESGTGLWVESLYVIDQNAAGEWEMYEFLHEDYCRQLREHFDTAVDGDDIWLVFDSQRIGAPELFWQGVSYRYNIGDQIEFEYTQDGIEIIAEVQGICTSGECAINAPSGYRISAQVKHLGNGNWKLSDVRCRTN